MGEDEERRERKVCVKIKRGERREGEMKEEK